MEVFSIYNASIVTAANKFYLYLKTVAGRSACIQLEKEKGEELLSELELKKEIHDCELTSKGPSGPEHQAR